MKDLVPFQPWFMCADVRASPSPLFRPVDASTRVCTLGGTGPNPRKLLHHLGVFFVHLLPRLIQVGRIDLMIRSCSTWIDHGRGTLRLCRFLFGPLRTTYGEPRESRPKFLSSCSCLSLMTRKLQRCFSNGTSGVLYNLSLCKRISCSSSKCSIRSFHASSPSCPELVHKHDEYGHRSCLGGAFPLR